MRIGKHLTRRGREDGKMERESSFLPLLASPSPEVNMNFHIALTRDCHSTISLAPIDGHSYNKFCSFKDYHNFVTSL